MLRAFLESVDSLNIPKGPGLIRSHFGVWKLKLCPTCHSWSSVTGSLMDTPPHGCIVFVSATGQGLMTSVGLWFPPAPHHCCAAHSGARGLGVVSVTSGSGRSEQELDL